MPEWFHDLYRSVRLGCCMFVQFLQKLNLLTGLTTRHRSRCSGRTIRLRHHCDQKSRDVCASEDGPMKTNLSWSSRYLEGVARHYNRASLSSSSECLGLPQTKGGCYRTRGEPCLYFVLLIFSNTNSMTYILKPSRDRTSFTYIPFQLGLNTYNDSDRYVVPCRRSCQESATLPSRSLSSCQDLLS